MTQVIAEPEITATVAPAATVDDETPTCTAGYTWCEEDCQELAPVAYADGRDGWEPDDYHRGTVAYLPMLRFTPDGWQDLADTTLIVRHDENEGDDTRPLIMIDYPSRDASPGMTPEQARQNAAWLLNAADLLDPLPAGVMVTTAANVRIGDDLLTDDGWQKVNGLLFFSDTEQATIFTPERPDEQGDGWDLSLNTSVKVRRPLTGSCAIQFQEPIR